jgi:hypothetical protein
MVTTRAPPSIAEDLRMLPYEPDWSVFIELRNSRLSSFFRKPPQCSGYTAQIGINVDNIITHPNIRSDDGKFMNSYILTEVVCFYDCRFGYFHAFLKGLTHVPVQQLAFHLEGGDGLSGEYFFLLMCDSLGFSDKFVPLKVVCIATDVVFTGSPV